MRTRATTPASEANMAAGGSTPMTAKNTVAPRRLRAGAVGLDSSLNDTTPIGTDELGRIAAPRSRSQEHSVESAPLLESTFPR